MFRCIIQNSCCEDALGSQLAQELSKPKLTRDGMLSRHVQQATSRYNIMSAAYVPPNRRSSMKGRGLGIKRTPRFDLSKQTAAFPSLSKSNSGASPAPTPLTQSSAPNDQLETFLEKAAIRTERIRRRGHRVKKPKCPIGWVTLPQRQETQEPVPYAPRRADYRKATIRNLGYIQSKRDLENEILGPHSPWIETPNVWDALTYNDDSEIDYCSGEDESSQSDTNDDEDEY